MCILNEVWYWYLILYNIFIQILHIPKCWYPKKHILSLPRLFSLKIVCKGKLFRFRFYYQNSLRFLWFWVKCALISMVSCQKGPTRHAYALGPFWQDTLDMYLRNQQQTLVEILEDVMHQIHWFYQFFNTWYCKKKRRQDGRGLHRNVWYVSGCSLGQHYQGQAYGIMGVRLLTAMRLWRYSLEQIWYGIDPVVIWNPH